MATPNIVNVATINAKNATGAITTSRATAVVLLVPSKSAVAFLALIVATFTIFGVAIVYFPFILFIQKRLPSQLLFQLKP